MAIKVGDKLPSAILMEMKGGTPQPVKTDDFFGGKKVAVFALPGAFTPTCSAKHLPGFIQHADSIKAKGIDTIACISVNDAFVMGAWGDQQGAGDKVAMLADGNGDFTRALGLEMDATQIRHGQAQPALLLHRRQRRGHAAERRRAGRLRRFQRRSHAEAALRKSFPSPGTGRGEGAAA